MNKEIQEAVHAELTLFAKHMQDIAFHGKPISDWILEGLDWYIAREA